MTETLTFFIPYLCHLDWVKLSMSCSLSSPLLSVSAHHLCLIEEMQHEGTCEAYAVSFSFCRVTVLVILFFKNFSRRWNGGFSLIFDLLYYIKVNKLHEDPLGQLWLGKLLMLRFIWCLYFCKFTSFLSWITLCFGQENSGTCNLSQNTCHLVGRSSCTCRPSCICFYHGNV